MLLEPFVYVNLAWMKKRIEMDDKQGTGDDNSLLRLLVKEGYAMKCRPDALYPMLGVGGLELYRLMDWKTTSKNTLAGMKFQIQDLGYDLSLYFYAETLRVLGRHKLHDRAVWYFLPPKPFKAALPIYLDLPQVEQRLMGIADGDYSLRENKQKIDDMMIGVNHDYYINEDGIPTIQGTADRREENE